MSSKRSIFRTLMLCAAVFYSPLTFSAGDSLKSRPNSHEPTRIQTSFLLIDVREIDGARQTFTGDVAVRLSWKDPRLASSEKSRSLPLTAAWNPGIQLVNRVSVQTTLPELLEVDGEGNVIYRQRYIGQFSCILNLKEFPFDRQTIPVRITAPGISPSEVHFVQDPQTGIVPTLAITDWKVSLGKSGPDAFQLIPGGRSLAGYRFEFIAERRFYFFLVQIILPMALIVGMSWIVFWLDPTQPGPRISIAITSMLTIVAYRLLLANFLPRLSFLTRMDFFVFACTFLVFLTLVIVVAINRLLVTKKEGAGLKLDRHARWIFPLMFALVIVNCFFI